MIDGIGVRGACPECGLAVAESLPEARTGVSWQNHGGPIGWVLGVLEALAKPARSYSLLRIDRERDALWHVLATCIIAAAIPSMVWSLELWEGLRQPEDRNLLTHAVRTLMMVAAGTGVLFTLTRIEQRGIRLWGRVNGRRIDKPIAHRVCAHASAGWVIGALLIFPGAALGEQVEDWGFSNSVGAFRPIVNAAPVVGSVLGFGIGLLWFEVLVYIGAKRCRFANAARR
ncbi:MAG: hypothetical protein AAGB51_00525 [Planctomycetota bacterium]